MKNKNKMISYLMKNKKIYDTLKYSSYKKIFFFQNPMCFRYCHFIIECDDKNIILISAISHKNHLTGFNKVAKVLK